MRGGVSDQGEGRPLTKGRLSWRRDSALLWCLQGVGGAVHSMRGCWLPGLGVWPLRRQVRGHLAERGACVHGKRGDRPKGSEQKRGQPAPGTAASEVPWGPGAGGNRACGDSGHL